MNRTIWITGASGFLGRHLIKYLAEHESQAEVIGLDVNIPNFQVPPTRFIQVDISDPGVIAALLDEKPPSVVYHLVGVLPPADAETMWRVNAGVTQRFAMALATNATHTIRFVSTGSAAEYGALGHDSVIREDFRGIPVNAYGESKLAASNLLLGLNAWSNLDVIIVRPFNFVGPGLSTNLVLGDICEQLRDRRSTVRVGPLEPVRDFLDVRDAVEAYALLARKGEPGEIYNLCSGVGQSIQDALDMALSLIQDDINVESKTGIPPGVARAVGCCEKIRLATGWTPHTSLRTSLMDMLG